MKKFLIFLSLSALSLHAHFGMLIPSKNIIEDQKDANISLNYAFMHPFEQSYMKLELQKAGVFFENKITDINQTLKPSEHGFIANYEPTNPGVYQFYFVPKPYFEPAEGKFIKHLTKTIINAFGGGEDWDKPIGLKAEIIPLTRPFGLYANSIFSAKVLFKGKVVPNAEVEIEFFNDQGFKAPSEDHITQVVKTNANGEFSFVLNQPGWWAFSALLEDEETMQHEGKSYPVELGALIWVKADKMGK